MNDFFIPAPAQTPEILPDTDPRLRLISEPVTEFNDELRTLAGSMIVAMQSKNGLGLAAIQLGTPLRVVIVREDTNIIVMVNPVVSRLLRRDVTLYEGCLSVPRHKWKYIARPAKCDVTYQDLEGHTHTFSASGMLARAIQHEVHHLDGILINDLPAERKPTR